jgi:1-acyl-sn-glycerol-3-phosphate acyltransferase
LNARANSAAVAPTANILVRAWGVIATVLSVLFTAILLIPVAVAGTLRHSHWASPVMRLWSWLVFHTCGIRAEVEGLEHLRGLDSFILVANHKSLLDVVAITHLIRREVRFVAKRELGKVPLLGYAMAHSGNILIDRQSGGRAIRHALTALREGYTMCFFAEGHRFNDNLVHEFNDGAAWLAIATKQPCVPLALSGTQALAPRGAKFVRPGLRIRLMLGAPIATAGMRGGDRVELSRRLETAVREMFRADF